MNLQNYCKTMTYGEYSNDLEFSDLRIEMDALSSQESPKVSLGQAGAHGGTLEKRCWRPGNPAPNVDPK